MMRKNAEGQQPRVDQAPEKMRKKDMSVEQVAAARAEKAKSFFGGLFGGVSKVLGKGLDMVKQVAFAPDVVAAKGVEAVGRGATIAAEATADYAKKDWQRTVEDAQAVARGAKAVGKAGLMAGAAAGLAVGAAGYVAGKAGYEAGKYVAQKGKEVGVATGRVAKSGAESVAAGALKGAMAVESGAYAAGRGVKKGAEAVGAGVLMGAMAGVEAGRYVADKAVAAKEKVVAKVEEGMENLEWRARTAYAKAKNRVSEAWSGFRRFTNEAKLGVQSSLSGVNREVLRGLQEMSSADIRAVMAVAAEIAKLKEQKIAQMAA